MKPFRFWIFVAEKFHRKNFYSLFHKVVQVFAVNIYFERRQQNSDSHFFTASKRFHNIRKVYVALYFQTAVILKPTSYELISAKDVNIIFVLSTATKSVRASLAMILNNDDILAAGSSLMLFSGSVSKIL